MSDAEVHTSAVLVSASGRLQMPPTLSKQRFFLLDLKHVGGMSAPLDDQLEVNKSFSFGRRGIDDVGRTGAGDHPNSLSSAELSFFYQRRQLS